MEDRGCDPRGLMSWVFTLGEPADDVWAAFRRMTESGYLDWVLIPIFNETIQTLRPASAGDSIAL